MSEKIYLTIRKALLFWTGLCLVLIGIVSLAVPFIPGFILIFLGMSILSRATKNIARCPVINSLRTAKAHIAVNRDKISKAISLRLNS